MTLQVEVTSRITSLGRILTRRLVPEEATFDFVASEVTAFLKRTQRGDFIFVYE